MAVSLKHNYRATLPDSPDPTQIQPQRDWNDEHALTQGPASLLGRPDGAAGFAPTVEILLDPATMTFTPDGKLASLAGAPPDLTIYAKLDSPVFTGTPTAPSPPANDDSQRLATTAWVQDELATADIDWSQIVNEPAAFPPTVHTHDWTSGITGKPATFPPSAHSHVIADVTGLQTALDGKAALVHSHTASQITDFSEALDDRVAALLVAGTNIGLVYDDTANTLTINASGGSGGGIPDAPNDGVQYGRQSVGWTAIVPNPTTLPPSGAAGGALTGSYPNPTLVGGPLSSYALASSIPTTLPPSGAAGGALTGNYPNPTLVGGPLSNYLTTATAATTYQPLDADLTALAGLSATVGLVEQTGAAAFTKRALGTAAGTSVPTLADADARYVQTTSFNENVDDRVAALLVQGTNITLTYNDVANTLTVAAAAYPTALPPNGAAGGDLAGSYPNPTIKVPMTLNGGTVVANAPVATFLQTWNAGAVAFTGVLINITATARAAASYVQRWQQAGTDIAYLDYLGNLTLGGYSASVLHHWSNFTTPLAAGGAQDMGYLIGSTAHFGMIAGSGAPTATMARGSLYLRSDGAPYYNEAGTGVWSPVNTGSQNAQATLGSNTVIGTTKTAVVNTGSIGANGQVWEIIAFCMFCEISGGAGGYYDFDIWNGTVAVAHTSNYNNVAGGQQCTMLVANVTLTGATTFSLRGSGPSSFANILTDARITAKRLS